MRGAAGSMSERKHKFGLKPQLLLLLFVLNLITATAYSIVLYRIERSEILAGIDTQLLTAVNATRAIIPSGYHERIRDRDSISPEEFDALQDRLAAFANGSRLAYVSTYKQFGTEVRTVSRPSSSSSPITSPALSTR